MNVIVDLAVEPEPDGSWDPAAIKAVQRELLEELGDGVTVAARYKATPQIALALGRRALGRLRASPLVVGIHLNEADAPTE